MKLEDAVCHRTIVKLDVWAEVDKNLFTEVTNVFLLLWSKTKRGKKMYLNLPMGDYIHKMLYEIKHYGSGDKANYMKTLKRMWTLATYLNRVKPGSEKKYINKLKSLFTDELSVLYQLYSEAEVIEEMVSKLRNPPYKKLASQLDRFKARFNTVWPVRGDKLIVRGLPQPEYINFEVEFYKRIDKLIEELNKPRDKIKRNFLKKHLAFIQEGLLYLWNGRIDKSISKKLLNLNTTLIQNTLENNGM